MNDKLKSKMFNKSLDSIKDFLSKELKELSALKDEDIQKYRDRLGHLQLNGINVHMSIFTSEPISISIDVDKTYKI